MTAKKPAHEVILANLEGAVHGLQSHHEDLLTFSTRLAGEKRGSRNELLYTSMKQKVSKEVQTDKLLINKFIYLLIAVCWPDKLVADIVKQEMCRILLSITREELAGYVQLNLEELVAQIEYLEEESKDDRGKAPGS